MGGLSEPRPSLALRRASRVPAGLTCRWPRHLPRSAPTRHRCFGAHLCGCSWNRRTNRSWRWCWWCWRSWCSARLATLVAARRAHHRGSRERVVGLRAAATRVAHHAFDPRPLLRDSGVGVRRQAIRERPSREPALPRSQGFSASPAVRVHFGGEFQKTKTKTRVFECSPVDRILNVCACFYHELSPFL